MPSEKRKVYFSSITARTMLDNTPVKDLPTIQQIFQQTENAYRTALQSGNVDCFQIGNSDKEVLMITDLHYTHNFLCGRIGRCTKGVNQFLRESNPLTFAGKELTPSEGNLFENYSYFVISPAKMRVGYLRNNKVCTNIPKLIMALLRRNLGSLPYELEISDLMDYDIKSKIKAMKNSVVVKGRISGQDISVVNGMRSIGRIRQVTGTPLKTTVTIYARVNKPLTDADIDEITDVVTGEEGFDAFTVMEEEDEEQEVVDVVKRQSSLSRAIDLTAEERKQQDVIWQKMCSVM